MKLATLLTQNEEIPCVILPVQKQLFPIGKEVLVYAQNRIVKGYIQDEENLIAELDIVIDFAIIPELDEFIKENEVKPIVTGEIYYV